MGVTEPDHQGNWFAQFPLHNGGKAEYGWNIGDLLTHVLVSPCPVIKEQRPDSGRTVNGPDPSGIKI